MALRAGYYGLKNSVKKALENLAADIADAKIIKSVGDGLSLSAQGALAANIDSDTMEFKDHKLAAKVSSAAVIDDLISEAVSTTGEFTLTHDFTDYDLIEFIITDNAHGYYSSYFTDKNTLNSTSSSIKFLICDYQYQTLNRSARVYKTESNKLYLAEIANDISIVGIKGIKL